MACSQQGHVAEAEQLFGVMGSFAPEAESLSIFIPEEPKVKDLGDSLPPRPKETASQAIWPADTFGQSGRQPSLPMSGSVPN